MSALLDISGRVTWTESPTSSVFQWKEKEMNLTAAIVYFREACRIVPSNPVYRYRLGMAYCRAGVEVRPHDPRLDAPT